MRAGAAIAAVLTAALALPGCGGGAGEPAGGGARERALAAGGDAARAIPRPAPPAPARAHEPARAHAAGPSRRAAPARHATRRRTAPGRPAVLPSPLLRAFPILRRPASSGDRPAGQARALLEADNREGARTGEAPLRAGAARRLAASPSSPPAWIVPAPGRLCVLRGEPLSGGEGPEAIECVGTRAAMRGYLMSSFSGLAGAPGRSFVEGVLPAGARRARLELAGGGPVPLALHEGWYAVAARGAKELRFERAGHMYTIPVPQPIAPPDGGATPAASPAGPP